MRFGQISDPRRTDSKRLLILCSCRLLEHSLRTRSQSVGVLDLAESAVHVDFNTGDVRGILGRKKSYGPGNPRVAQIVSSVLCNDLFREFIYRFPWHSESPEDRGDDWPRSNCIDPHAAAGEFGSFLPRLPYIGQALVHGHSPSMAQIFQKSRLLCWLRMRWWPAAERDLTMHSGQS